MSSTAVTWIVIGVIVFLSIIFAFAGWWNFIFHQLSFLDIRINLGGYVFISTVLLIIWLVVYFFFDKQTYMVFTPGQLRVRLEIGEGETAYDTMGMTVQKQRSDLFRHWILGLGSGDMIVKTHGAQVHEFNLPNVLFLGRKLKQVEDMLRSRPISPSRWPCSTSVASATSPGSAAMMTCWPSIRGRATHCSTIG